MSKIFFKVSYAIEIARCIWLLVGLVRLLKSSHKDKSDLTSPTSSHKPDTDRAVSVVYDTSLIIIFPTCMFILFDPYLTVK